LLTTLQHAADLLTEVFAPVNAKLGALDHCIRLLMEVGECGGKEWIEAVTSQLE